MDEEAYPPSSAPALWLALLALVVVPAQAPLVRARWRRVRARWRRAAARREKVRRPAHLAAEEAELAERASVLAYCDELFPGVVHGAEVRVEPEWDPHPVAAAAVAVPGPAAQEVSARGKKDPEASPLLAWLFPPPDARRRGGDGTGEGDEDGAGRDRCTTAALLLLRRRCLLLLPLVSLAAGSPPVSLSLSLSLFLRHDPPLPVPSPRHSSSPPDPARAVAVGAAAGRAAGATAAGPAGHPHLVSGAGGPSLSRSVAAGVPVPLGSMLDFWPQRQLHGLPGPASLVTFSFSTRVLGKQQVDAHIYLWKWNAKIVISDVDGTITRSDVLGQFMPLVGRDWCHSGVARLFSAIKENGYQLLFLSARAIVQAYLTKNFLFNLKQDGKALSNGPVVISLEGLFP